MLARKDVLAGLLFIAVAALGLWLSRDYPIGTALRMGTGYVPRLLCWTLLALGCLILFQGLRDSRPRGAHAGSPNHADEHHVGSWGWRALLGVGVSLAVFALALETLGLVLSILLLTGIGALAGPGLKPLETAIAAIVLIVLSWAIFIL